MAKASRARVVRRLLNSSRNVVEDVPLDQMTLPNRQARRHSERQIQMLTGSLERFGPLVPVLLTADSEIVSGVARVEAARRLGWTSFPAIRITHLSRGEIEAYRVADNRLCELGTWDNEALRDALLTAEELEIDFGALGFEIAEADLIINPPGDQGGDLESFEPRPDSLLRIGDRFSVDDHVVVCGDANARETTSGLYEPGTVTAVITDPPYNCTVAHHILSHNRHGHDEFPMASGEMTDEEFYAFLLASLLTALAALVEGGLIYMFIDWRGIRTLLNAGAEAGLDLINIVVFKKNNSGMGSFYRSQHELVCVFRKPGAQHRNNIQLGRYGRNRSNVWEYPGANSFGPTRDSDLAMHPSVKNCEMIADAILDCTKRKDAVLDLYGGSGTTLIAAQRTGRIARIVELSPGYVETILRRYQAEFGRRAVHTETGLTLDDLIAHRQGQAPSPSARPPRRRVTLGGAG